MRGVVSVSYVLHVHNTAAERAAENSPLLPESVMTASVTDGFASWSQNLSVMVSRNQHKTALLEYVYGYHRHNLRTAFRHGHGTSVNSLRFPFRCRLGCSPSLPWRKATGGSQIALYCFHTNHFASVIMVV